MYRIAKIRIYPNSIQKRILNINFNGVRFVRNKYIEYMEYKNNHRFMQYRKFDKMLTQLKRFDPNYTWLAEEHVSTKAIKDALHNEEKRWCRYFKDCAKYKQGELEGTPTRPTFISKKHQRRQSMFIVKNNIRYDGYGRRLISLPTIGITRISEPIDHLPPIELVTSGIITLEGNKYYLCIRYKPDKVETKKSNIGIGIDLGIKKYATIAYKDYDKNIILIGEKDHFIFNDKYKIIQEKIKTLKRVISHKSEINYGTLLNQWLDMHPGEELSEISKNKLRSQRFNTSSIMKVQYKINKLETKLANIRKDFIYQLVNRLVVITKRQNSIITPKYITLEGLEISKMLKSPLYINGIHTFHQHIANSGWYLFAQVTKHKCEIYGCELRVANTYYPSSKTCYKCGRVNENLKLYHRTFRCKCGYVEDRDVNASLNLLKLINYTIIA